MQSEQNFLVNNSTYGGWQSVKDIKQFYQLSCDVNDLQSVKDIKQLSCDVNV